MFDLETDSASPETANMVEIAAVIIDPRKLEIIKDSEFSSKVRPPDIDEKDYYEKHKSTIEWHAKNHCCKPEDIFEEWKKNPEEKLVWGAFKEYLCKYNSEGRASKFNSPILAGMNILRFDIPIVERIAGKYGDIDKQNELKICHPRDKIDLMNILFMWFENNPEVESYAMDSMRPYFGIKTSGSHEAIKDTKDVALLLIKFLSLHRRFAAKVQFKGAFGEKS